MRLLQLLPIASILLPALEAQFVQQAIPLVGSGGSGAEGSAVALSADGNTALVGGWADRFGLRSAPIGAAWVFMRSGGVWSQQGAKLVGDPNPRSAQGASVGLSADGNTAIVGGPVNNLPCFYPLPPAGGAWIFARSGGVWSQQGGQLAAAGPVTGAVAISGDGSTASR